MLAAGARGGAATRTRPSFLRFVEFCSVRCVPDASTSTHARLPTYPRVNPIPYPQIDCKDPPPAALVRFDDLYLQARRSKTLLSALQSPRLSARACARVRCHLTPRAICTLPMQICDMAGAHPARGPTLAQLRSRKLACGVLNLVRRDALVLHSTLCLCLSSMEAENRRVRIVNALPQLCNHNDLMARRTTAEFSAKGLEVPL